MNAERSLLPDGVGDPTGIATMLERVGYLADAGVSMATYLTLALPRPLLLEGEPGVGKTALATALATALDLPLIRLQCHEGITAAQALYDWDFPRQLLHLRAAQAAAESAGRSIETGALEEEIYSRRFLLARPLLAAVESAPVVLLVDEVDRADDEFEAFLLELLSEYAVTVPEIGTITAPVPPVVIVTSNRTREVHDALKRRCLYQWVEHPEFDREVAIIRRRAPRASARLADDVARAVAVLRSEDLMKPPGVAESIDWTHALVSLGADHLDAATAIATLGAVLKYREDQLQVSRAKGQALAAALDGR